MGRRTEMDDMEMQTAHGDPDILHKNTQAAGDCCSICCIVVIAALVICVCSSVLIQYCTVDANFSVAIDSASSLDPATGLSFNLTVGITSYIHGSKACINPGMHLEVYYHGVQLAASPAEAVGLCGSAEPGKTAKKHVLAMATGVPVGRPMERLVADLKQDAAVFDVAFHIPVGSYSGGMAWYYDVKSVSTCQSLRVGAAAARCDSPDQEELFVA